MKATVEQLTLHKPVDDVTAVTSLFTVCGNRVKSNIQYKSKVYSTQMSERWAHSATISLSGKHVSQSPTALLEAKLHHTDLKQCSSVYG